MKISSYPPFIVFFDTLAIILFFLLIRQESSVDVRMQGVELPPGFSIVLEGDPGHVQRESDDVEILLPCNQLPQCRTRQPGNTQVKLPLSLVNEIGRLKLLSASKKCGKIVVYVDPDGRIDRQITVDHNPCLREIVNIERWVGKKDTLRPSH